MLENKVDAKGVHSKKNNLYDIINSKLSWKQISIAIPKKCLQWVYYAFMLPITHLVYLTTPDPIAKNWENFYPLTLFISICWIYGYTFFIVWWTYSVSWSWGINLSFIPMLLYPIGISIRDNKKFRDFIKVRKLFKDELADQELSLAETYSGPIF